MGRFLSDQCKLSPASIAWLNLVQIDTSSPPAFSISSPSPYLFQGYNMDDDDDAVGDVQDDDTDDGFTQPLPKWPQFRHLVMHDTSCPLFPYQLSQCNVEFTCHNLPVSMIFWKRKNHLSISCHDTSYPRMTKIEINLLVNILPLWASTEWPQSPHLVLTWYVPTNPRFLALPHIAVRPSPVPKLPENLCPAHAPPYGALNLFITLIDKVKGRSWYFEATCCSVIVVWWFAL